ncbi:hypothetical protein DLD77_05600 [Chitinophaga alhagiae]|uniref:Uncharacterized protein n=1 Tax=Chitinophaga alhagiae TaxID=2203219 RepID=A0ABM6WB80_9BACT|nr:hypothetical protein DLD77_05600 [Chitinophaga alhagiae]
MELIKRNKNNMKSHCWLKYFSTGFSFSNKFYLIDLDVWSLATTVKYTPNPLVCIFYTILIKILLKNNFYQALAENIQAAYPDMVR